MMEIVKKAVRSMRTTGVLLEVSGGVPSLVESSVGRLHCLKPRESAGQPPRSFLKVVSDEPNDAIIAHPTVTTVIDEPFVYDGAINYFSHSDPFFLRHFETHVASIPNASVKGTLWEEALPWILIHVLHGKTIKEVEGLFRLGEGRKMAAAMLDKKVEIVNWEERDLGIRHNAVSMTEFLDAHMAVADLADQDPMAPFFFPNPSTSGPDLVFVIRFADKKYPVFVQAKFWNEDRLPPKVVNDAVDTILAKKVNLHLDITKTSTEGLSDTEAMDTEAMDTEAMDTEALEPEALDMNPLKKYCPDGYYFSMLVTLPSAAAEVDATKLERVNDLEPILIHWRGIQQLGGVYAHQKGQAAQIRRVGGQLP